MTWSEMGQQNVQAKKVYLRDLRALDSISLLRYVVTTQTQFSSGFLIFAVSAWRPNFILVIVFPLESFSNHENVFCSKKRNA